MAVAGLDVIVVERGEPGRDKVCGDGLTPSAVTELALMGVDTTGWRRNKGLRVVGGGHILHIPWPEQASLPSYGLAPHGYMAIYSVTDGKVTLKAEDKEKTVKVTNTSGGPETVDRDI